MIGENVVATLLLERVRVGAQMSLSQHVLREMTVEPIIDRAAHAVTYHFETYMWGNMVHRSVLKTVRWPASWWQAFKETFFPDWLKRHYPVRYEERETSVQFMHVCPHLDFPESQGEEHLRYLIPSRGRG